MASANLDLVRSIYAAWGRGEFQSVDWADPKIEFTTSGSLGPSARTGLAGMAEGWRSWLSACDAYHAAAEEYRLLDDGRVVVIGRMSGRGKTSGVPVETEFANVFTIRDGKVTRLVLYPDREHAFADLGLDSEGDAP